MSPFTFESLYSTILISSPVTPGYVAPPLSPLNPGTHGGDRGSSVWRGGLPTHSRVGGMNCGGGGIGGGPGSGPMPLAPAPTPGGLASPVSPKLAPLAFWSLRPGTGAYSAEAVGLFCGTFKGLGRTKKTRIAATTPAAAGAIDLPLDSAIASRSLTLDGRARSRIGELLQVLRARSVRVDKQIAIAFGPVPRVVALTAVHRADASGVLVAAGRGAGRVPPPTHRGVDEGVVADGVRVVRAVPSGRNPRVRLVDVVERVHALLHGVDGQVRSRSLNRFEEVQEQVVDVEVEAAVRLAVGIDALERLVVVLVLDRLRAPQVARPERLLVLRAVG